MVFFTPFLVYLLLFVIGVAMIAISAVLGELHDLAVGHDVTSVHFDHSAESGADSSYKVGLSPVSPIMVSLLFAFFGTIGMMLTTFSDWSVIPVFVASLFAGVGGHLVVYFGLTTFLINNQSSSLESPNAAVGELATVTAKIAKDGIGEVMYVSGGGNSISSAKSDSEIDVGSKVKIVDVNGGVMTVQRMN